MESSPPPIKKIGLWTSTSLVIGNMIGAGVFLMPSALASYGGISLIGWIFSAGGAIFLALLFGMLSKMMPAGDGGPYAYTKKGFGDFPGFLVAWGYLISTLATNATIAVSFVGAMSLFVPILGTSAIAAVVTALSSIWLLTWINTLGIRAGGKVQVITTALKLAPLFIIAFGGLFFINLDYFHPFNLSGLSSFEAITATAAMTLFAFLGVECATIPSKAVENPEKTIPRATMIGTLITTVVYIFGTLSVLGAVPPSELQTSLTPFADAAAIMFGESSKYWVGAGVAISAFGALNGWILVQGQIPYAIAKDKLFPSIFAKENKRGAPASGIIISSLFVSFLVGMNYTKGLVEQFEFLVLLTTTTVLVPYLFSAGSLIILYAERKVLNTKGWINTIFIGLGAFSFSLWAIAGTGQESVFWGFLLLLAGIPFYIWVIINQNKKN
ncbi:MAG TPA: amino acid permease [Cyclobacteriaceae bacterium]|nr:amino acid permease [Cyclobacteriaceae bacterium]HRK53108.1 amino acid permease [Cyclobacteriaceae bacterium]